MTAPACAAGGVSRDEVRAASTALVMRLADIDTTTAARFGLSAAHRLPDLGISGRDAVTEAYRAAMDTLAAAGSTAGDHEGELLRSHAGAELALREHGDIELQLTAPFAPIGSLRALFAPAVDAHDSERAVRVRHLLAGVPAMLAAYRRRLADAVAHGHTAGPVQVRAAARTWHALARGGGLFRQAEGSQADAAGAALAESSLSELADWLEGDYLAATTTDAVGIDRYERAWRRRTASALSPRDAYDWAGDRLAELIRDRDALVARWGIDSASELREQLERGERADLGNRLLAADDVLEHLAAIHASSLSYVDAHVARVRGSLRRLDSAIGRAGGGESAHYQRATSARAATTVLPHAASGLWPTWALKSLWHHEGVPGHHLQLGGWLIDAERNGLYRSTIGALEAVTEGWAMYAETLMFRHGRLDELDTFGYLDGQILRTARVLVDVGLHAGHDLGLFVPGDDGRPWSPRAAVGFLTALRPGSEHSAAHEVVRHLAWPGQGSSYALGEHEWWAARGRAQARGGFDERDWHTRVLAAGSLTFASIDEAGRPS